jgi:ATP-binding cassette, subfamily B, bacterial PglK
MKKLFQILPNNEKKNMLFFFILSFCAMILETLSIALIFPLIVIILDREKSVELFSKFENLFQNLEYSELLTLLLITICIIYLIKNLFLIYCHWFSVSFTNRVEIKLQQKLFNLYLSQDYLDFLKQNISVKYRNCTNETSIFLKYLVAIMTFLFEITILLGVLSFFLFVQPITTLMISSVILFFFIIFYLIAKVKIYKWNKVRLFSSRTATKYLLEGFNAFKDIKIFGKSKLFLKLFTYHQRICVNLYRKITMINLMPKILIESLTIMIVSFVIIYMKNDNISNVEIVATLGIFSAAAFRLFPSVTRIIQTFNTIKGGLPSVDTIIKEIKSNELKKETEELITEKKIDFNNNILFNHVSFNYPSGNQEIIKESSFSIKKGTSVAISGNSGAGKSTLLSLLLGLVKPTKGKVTLDNIDIKRNFESIKHNFGYVSQEASLLDESIKFNITMVLDNDEIDHQKLDQVIKIANLSKFINSLEKKLETQVGEKAAKISGGQRQRIIIARALYNNPSIIILDEATSELDKNNEIEIIKKIIDEKNDKTLILISHNKDLINICDQVLLIKENQIFSN